MEQAVELHKKRLLDSRARGAEAMLHRNEAAEHRCVKIENRTAIVPDVVPDVVPDIVPKSKVRYQSQKVRYPSQSVDIQNQNFDVDVFDFDIRVKLRYPSRTAGACPRAAGGGPRAARVPALSAGGRGAPLASGLRV